MSHFKFYEDFNSIKWKNSEMKPITMIRVFYEDKRFIGKNRNEVTDLLGKENYKSLGLQDNQIRFRTDVFSPLVFTFKNDKVVNYSLECHD